MDKHKHKYLNDIGIKSDETSIFNTREVDEARDKLFKKQRKKYGFDERETWCLDYTLQGWLYSHLKMYLDVNIIDLQFYKFTIPILVDIPEEEREYIDHNKDFAIAYQKEILLEKMVTEEEAIKIALEYLEYSLTHDDYGCYTTEEITRARECAKCALKIVAEILPTLWW